MGYYIVKTSNPPHACPQPGWRERRKKGLKLGAVIRCDCGRTLTLRRSYEGDIQWYRSVV